jgi:hypothetical protein
MDVRNSQAYTNGTNWGETFGQAATAPGTAPASSASSSSSCLRSWENVVAIAGFYVGLRSFATTSLFTFIISVTTIAIAPSIYQLINIKRSFHWRYLLTHSRIDRLALGN